MPNNNRITELEAEVSRLSAELEKAKEQNKDRQESSKAMLFMLEDLERSRGEILRAKNEWETTFNNISNPIFIHDKQLNIIRANRAYQKMAGVPFEEIIGKPYYQVFPKMNGPFKMCFVAMQLQEDMEEEVFLPSMDNRIFKIGFYPIRDAEGRYLYSIHTLEDITERKQAELKMKYEMEVTKHLLMIAEATAHTAGIDRLMEQVISCTSKIMECDICLSYLYDKESRVFRPSEACGLHHDIMPLFRTELLSENNPFIKKAIKSGKPVIEEIAIRGLESEIFKWLEGINTAAIVPLIAREEPLGLIAFFYRREIKFIEVEKRIMEGISSQVSTALIESRLYKDSIDKAMELSHRIEDIRVMHEIDRSILSTLKPEEILETTTRAIGKVVSCDMAAIALLDKERQSYIYTAGIADSLILQGLLVPFKDTSAAEIMNTGRIQYVANLEAMKDILPFEDRLFKEGFLSYIRLPLMVKGELIGILNICSKRVSAFTPNNLFILERIASQITVAMEKARLLTDLKGLFMGTIGTLSDIIDAKSKWTRGHSDRVTEYAIAIGVEMEMLDKEIEDLRVAGLLHDIGKLGTYDIILNKPGKLTDEEHALVKMHPSKGAELLSSINQMSHIIPWIRGHHERWDGKGYPDGLKGEEIPLQARMLAVADTFDAMTADRPYRETPGKKKAVEEIRRYSGQQFDPEVVEAFLKTLLPS